jgi:thiol-disulfide isomerase/thioredoxin
MKKQLLFLTLTAFLFSCTGNKTSNVQTAEPQPQTEVAAEQNQAPEAPDFTLNDINGKSLTLSSLRGKYVVLDFWGSWCIWCIKGMPKMKEYYAKYADKLEILGVDCNDTVEKWKAAVAKHEIPWLHVYWDKEKGDNPVELYAVSGFPTKVVIDPEGRIAKVVVGESPAFYDYLDEVLK